MDAALAELRRAHQLDPNPCTLRALLMAEKRRGIDRPRRSVKLAITSIPDRPWRVVHCMESYGARYHGFHFKRYRSLCGALGGKDRKFVLLRSADRVDCTACCRKMEARA